MLEPIRCPRCTEVVSVESYETHLQVCPNDYCTHCGESFPREYLDAHRGECTRRPRRPEAAAPAHAVVSRQVSRRVLGDGAEERRTVETLSSGAQRVTVERVAGAVRLES